MAARIARLSEGVMKMPLADDQVAVAVAVGGGAEVGRVLAHHLLIEGAGVDEVRVGMMAAEIGQRDEVEHRTLGSAEAIFEDFLGVGAGDGAHGIEDDAEAA